MPPRTEGSGPPDAPSPAGLRSDLTGIRSDLTGLRSDLTGLRLALVGPGRVGTTLTAWAALRGSHLVRVGARRPEAAQVEAPGAEVVPLDRFESADCDLLLLAVADGALAEVAAGLAGRPQAPVVLHTSGSLGSSVLAPLAPEPDRPGGRAAGCFHPLKAFPRPLPAAADLERAAGTFYALDGPPAALALGERLAAAFGGVSGVVPEAARDLYHLGATVAAGGVATLVVSAGALAAELGLGDEASAAVRRGYLALARSALDAIEEALEADEESAAAGVTGPLARGDHATFLRELERLRSSAGGHAGGEGPPPRLGLLCHLGLETVRLTAGDPAARRLAEALRERGLPAPETR